VRANELDKQSARLQTWLGRFYAEIRKDSQKALDRFLNAYFMDPHHGDAEPLETRIRRINHEACKARVDKAVADGALAPVLADENPGAVLLALRHLKTSWDAKLVPALVELMAHDDPNVRWGATDALRANADASFDATL